MRAPRLLQAPGRDLTPRQLPSGKWLNCRHLAPKVEFEPLTQSGTWAGPSLVGFSPTKAQKAGDPTFGLVAHYHTH